MLTMLTSCLLKKQKHKCFLKREEKMTIVCVCVGGEWWRRWHNNCYSWSVCVCVCVWTEESVCVNSDSGFTPPDVSAADACFILRQNGCRVTLDDLLTRAENQIWNPFWVKSDISLQHGASQTAKSWKLAFFYRTRLHSDFCSFKTRFYSVFVMFSKSLLRLPALKSDGLFIFLIN